MNFQNRYISKLYRKWSILFPLHYLYFASSNEAYEWIISKFKGEFRIVLLILPTVPMKGCISLKMKLLINENIFSRITSKQTILLCSLALAHFLAFKHCILHNAYDHTCISFNAQCFEQRLHNTKYDRPTGYDSADVHPTEYKILVRVLYVCSIQISIQIITNEGKTCTLN